MKPGSKIMCLAVDDEPPALEILNNYINAVPSLELAGTCINAIDAINFLHKVAMDDIVFIESLKDYIKVVTKSKTIITRQSISAIEERLPKASFIRIHRSFIVSLSKVQSYSPELIAIGNEELPVSRMYRHEVEKVFR